MATEFLFSPPGSVVQYVPLEGKNGQAFINTVDKVVTDSEAGVTSFGNPDARPGFAHIACQLSGETEIVGDYGAMLWQKSAPGAITIDTGCHSGGCCHGYWRGCARESCCQNRYAGKGEVAFGFDLPGDMLPFSCQDGKGWVISKGTFICGTPNLTVSGKWKGCVAWCCSGEGGFLTHVTCEEKNNVFYAGGFGCIQRQDVPAGMALYANNGLFFAAADDIQFMLQLPGDCYSCMFGGEGLVMKFQGPCTVYTQNRDPDAFMKLLNPRPAKQGGGGEDGAGAAAGA